MSDDEHPQYTTEAVKQWLEDNGYGQLMRAFAPEQPNGEKRLAFEKRDRGFTLRVWRLSDTSALAEVTRGDELVRTFTYPAYGIWNLEAHFVDFVDSELSP